MKEKAIINVYFLHIPIIYKKKGLSVAGHMSFILSFMVHLSKERIYSQGWARYKVIWSWKFKQQSAVHFKWTMDICPKGATIYIIRWMLGLHLLFLKIHVWDIMLTVLHWSIYANNLIKIKSHHVIAFIAYL